MLLPVLFAFSPLCAGDTDLTAAITQNITRSISDNVTKSLNFQMLEPKLKVNNASGSIRQMSLSQNGFYLGVVTEDNTVHVWDLKNGVMRFKLNPQLPVAALVISDATPEGKNSFLVLGFTNGDIQIFDAKTPTVLDSFNWQGHSISTLSVSPDGGLLAGGSSDGQINIWNLGNKFQQLSSWETGDRDIGSLSISSDNKRLISGSKNGHTEEWEIAGARKINATQLDSSVLNVAFAEANKNKIAVTQRGVNLIGADSSSPTLMENAGNQDVAAGAIVAEGGIGVVGTQSGQIRLIDINNGKTLNDIKTNNQGIKHLAYVASSRQIISADDNGQIHFWDSATGKEQLQIVITHTGWAVLDSSGRYDGTEQGMQDVSWVTEKNEMNLAKLSKAFFEPGLLKAYATGNGAARLKAVTDKFTNGVALPPKMEIDFPDGPYDANTQLPPIVVVATDQGGGIGEIRLYHNGKLVNPGSLVKTEDVEVKDHHLRVAGYSLKPVPGLNTFLAVGTGLWDIEGYSPTVVKNVTGADIPSTLHLLSVGINKYRDARLNLDYSVPDSDSISKSIKGVSGRIFPEIKEYTLRDANATKANIVGKLGEIAAQAKSEDVVVLYFAGHGLVVGNEWLFMPYETALSNSEQDYANVGLSSSTLQELLIKSNAKRILLLIDSCQSGATTEAFREQQKFQRKFLRDISRVAGITVIAAARKDQSSAETATLGHGLFTYELITALQGKADVDPADNKITAHELAQYIADELPIMSLKYVNFEQQPMSFMLGSDFILADKP